LADLTLHIHQCLVNLLSKQLEVFPVLLAAKPWIDGPPHGMRVKRRVEVTYVKSHEVRRARSARGPLAGEIRWANVRINRPKSTEAVDRTALREWRRGLGEQSVEILRGQPRELHEVNRMRNPQRPTGHAGQCQVEHDAFRKTVGRFVVVQCRAALLR